MTALAQLDFRSPAGLLALQSLPRIGPATALRATLQATRIEAQLERHGSRLDEAYARAQADLDGYAEAGVELLGFFDERYPERLRELSDPPPLIYVQGDIELLARERLAALVGTREPTTVGIAAATTLTGALADAGWGIVSGLARGIDTIAHQTALERGAATIAVLGGGLDRIYPAENRALAARIVESGGALISEQPFGAPARPQRLVARDRLQSGLSVSVVIAQSGLNSGTMHTARFAAAQGRALLCPPAPACETSEANAGLRVLLERPARELCSILPAWRRAGALCARLGDRPVAQAVSLDDLAGFVQTMELAHRWPELTRDRRSLILAPRVD
jgi:DNA processing protein